MNGGGSDNNVYDDGILSKKSLYFCRFMKALIYSEKRCIKGVDASFMNSKLFTVKLDNFSTQAL